MKKLFVIFAILLFFVSFSKAQHLSEIAMINLDVPNLMEEYPFHSIEFKLNSKLSTGQYFIIYISDILEKRIEKISDEESKRYVVSFEDDKGNFIYTTWADFLKKNIKHQPVLILEKSKKYVKDTIVIREKKIKKGKNESLKTEKELMASLSKTVFLQISRLNMSEIEKYFRKNSIIFPQDQSTYRWIENARNIRVYRID